MIKRLLKAQQKRKQIHTREIPLVYQLIFQWKLLQARREWQSILKVLKAKKSAAKNTLSARLPFRMKGDKTFPKQKLKEFMTTKSALQEMLKGTLRVERKYH